MIFFSLYEKSKTLKFAILILGFLEGFFSQFSVVVVIIHKKN